MRQWQCSRSWLRGPKRLPRLLLACLGSSTPQGSEGSGQYGSEGRLIEPNEAQGYHQLAFATLRCRIGRRQKSNFAKRPNLLPKCGDSCQPWLRSRRTWPGSGRPAGLQEGRRIRPPAH